MIDEFALSEGERAQANMIRVGRVTEVDAAQALAKLRVGGFDTDWLPWAVHRAGGTRTASAPTVGEQRLLFSPFGDDGQGVIGPAIYQEDHAAPTDSATVEATEFSDGTRVEYDTASHTLTVTVQGGPVLLTADTVTVTADSVTVDAAETTFTGNVTIEGDGTFTGGAVTHGGKNIGKDHTHGGVQSGSANTAPPN